MVVASKWLGTKADRHDMEKLQLDQVLRRNFGSLAMFSFASTLICTWEFILGGLSLSLINGGTAGLFWSFIIVTIGLAAVYLSLCELGSIVPTSGGQYYWVAILAPRNCHRYLSYLTGWLCATSWQTSLASASFFAGITIQGLITLNNASYVGKGWHGTLLTIAVALVAILFNTVLAKRLPLVEGVLAVLHLLGVFILVPLWALSPISKGGDVFTTFYNGGGYSSIGLSAMVGMFPVVTSMTGLDCSVHMAEEIKDSSRTLPVSLMTGYWVNALLGFFAVLTVMFTAGDVSTVLASKTGFPFIDLFYNSTKSYAGTNVMCAVVIVNFTASAIAVLATASRQLWSFARNEGVPFSHWLAPTVLVKDIPFNALFVTLAIAIALSLINIGSSAALAAIFTISTASLMTSYMLTISCLINWRLKGNTLPIARFTLGRWGLWVNIAAMCFLMPWFIFSFFPNTVNPTLATMNWGCVMYGFIIIFSTGYYIIFGKHTYKPPTEQVKQIVVEQDQFYVGSEDSEKEAEHHQVSVSGEKEML